jgi:hypothetical protein
VFNLFTVALPELAEIIDNATIQPMEAFDDNGVCDELLLSAVKEHENQQIIEADHTDKEIREAFDNYGVGDELLLSAVQAYENHQVVETDHFDKEIKGNKFQLQLQLQLSPDIT